jgi:hypothetical protein
MCAQTRDAFGSQVSNGTSLRIEAAMTTGWVYHERYMWHDTGRATTISPDPEVATLQVLKWTFPLARRNGSEGGSDIRLVED